MQIISSLLLLQTGARSETLCTLSACRWRGRSPCSRRVNGCRCRGSPAPTTVAPGAGTTAARRLKTQEHLFSPTGNKPNRRRSPWPRLLILLCNSEPSPPPFRGFPSHRHGDDARTFFVGWTRPRRGATCCALCVVDWHNTLPCRHESFGSPLHSL